jgi:hypothetical protein
MEILQTITILNTLTITYVLLSRLCYGTAQLYAQ